MALDKRVKFDFEIKFSNGGGLQGQDFRLDLGVEDESHTISETELAAYIVRDMRLLMVSEVKILNKAIISEKHQRPTLNKLVDLSHTITDGLVTYKGLPAPVICDYLSRENSRANYEAGTEFQIGKIEMVSNTGTYVDCPFHRYANGKDLSQVALESFANLDGVVVRVDYHRTLAIGPEFFEGLEIKGRAVLINTGWASHWNTPAYYENHPFLTAEAATYLQQSGVKLVGIDSHNIDDTKGKTRPVHSTLLAAEILIVEHLCQLEALPNSDFSFSAIPPKFKGVGTFPVRAFASLR